MAQWNSEWRQVLRPSPDDLSEARRQSGTVHAHRGAIDGLNVGEGRRSRVLAGGHDVRRGALRVVGRGVVAGAETLREEVDSFAVLDSTRLAGLVLRDERLRV